MRSTTSIILLFAFTSLYTQATNRYYSDEVVLRGAVSASDNFAEDGVKFSCSVLQLANVEKQMSSYLSQLGIKPSLYKSHFNARNQSLTYTLTTPPSDYSTVDLRFRPEMDIRDQLVTLPSSDKSTKTVVTVSTKEIVLALMQHGRLTEFAGNMCSAESFIDHVNIRQNTVAWAESLNWDWPDGGRAKLNTKYWGENKPVKGVSLSKAIDDAFKNQRKYSIGCYMASKLVMLQGVLDYYNRIKRTPKEAIKIEQRLMEDGEPMHHVEYGKLLELRYSIPSTNFVPGDWGYIRNTDEKSSDITGYEGSNAIYFGRNRFDDFYNEHNHYYLFHEKLDEVYQWRNEVFNHPTDIEKVTPLTEREYIALEATPAKGGLVSDARVFYLSMPTSAEVTK